MTTGQLSLRQRIIGIVLLGPIILGILSTLYFAYRSRQDSALYTALVERTKTSLSMEIVIYEKVSQELNMLTGLLRIKDPDQIEDTAKKLEEYRVGLADELKACGASCSGIAEAVAKFNNVSQEAQQLILMGNLGMAGEKIQTELNPLFNEISRLLKAFSDELQKSLATDMEQVQAAITRNLALLVGVELVILVALALFSSRVAIEHIINPIVRVKNEMIKLKSGDTSVELQSHGKDELGQMIDAIVEMVAFQRERNHLAHAIAGGDLSQEIKLASSRDELGMALAEMVKSLNQMIVKIKATAADFAVDAKEISGAAQALSQGASEQAAATEEISSSMTELAGKTDLNLKNVEKSRLVVSRAFDASTQVKQRSEELMGAIEAIRAASTDIGTINRVVDSVSFQTNLLALNAAVEAARAGAHGKGFAVVAEEVRNLAGRSAAAAKETTEIVARSDERVARGIEIAKETYEALAGITEEVTEVDKISVEIASGSSDQAQGFKQIQMALHQIDKVTQLNTASAEETAAASQGLNQKAQELLQLLEGFRLKA
jgi:methyl-accepting chemotaxis protein